MKRRIISMLLAAALIFAMSVVSASAKSSECAWDNICLKSGETTADRIIEYLNETAKQGKSVLGAFDYPSFDPNNYNNIANRFGVTPAIYNTFYAYNKATGSLDCEQPNQNIIEHWNNGAICMVHSAFKWAADLIKDSSEKTDFLLNFDAENENRNEDYYNAYLKFRSQTADAFEELKNAGVTVIFRLFVEMTNSNFWYYYTKTDEGYASFKRIWRQYHDYMEKERGLDNIIWCFAPQAAGGWDNGGRFWPGDEYVDIIGPTLYSYGNTSDTKYNINSYSGTWWNKQFEGYYNLGKPVGFSELGVAASTEKNDDGTPREPGDFNDLLEHFLPLYKGKISFCLLWAAENGPCFDGNETKPANVGGEEFVNNDYFVSLPQTLTALGHTYSHHAESAATCESGGMNEYYSCDVCGKVFDSNKIETTLDKLTIAAKGHTLTHHDESAATCESGGMNEYYSCDVCGKVFDRDKSETTLDKLTIAANGHALTHHAESAATCESGGMHEYYSCDVCGKVFDSDKIETSLDKLTITAKGHSYSHHAESAATCESGGMHEYYSCDVCGKVFDSNKIETTLDKLAIAAKGHTLTHHDESAATCESGGMNEYYSCDVCGKVFDRDKSETTLDKLTIAANGHNFGEWIVVTPATAYHTGVRERICSNCGEKMTETIPKIYVVFGDLNSDGKINLLDLIAMRKHLAKWNIEIDTTAADCNGDGKLNLLDLILLRKYLAKWKVTLGPQEQ